MVLSAAFSTEVNTQTDDKKEPEIAKNAKELFKISFFSPIIFIVRKIFMHIAHVFTYTKSVNEELL